MLYTNKRLYHTTYTCENIHWVKIHNLCENTHCICKIHIMCEVTYRVPGDEYQLWACWGILAKGNNGRQIMKRKRNHVSHLWIGIVRKRFCLRDPFFEDDFFLIWRRIFLIFWKNFPNLDSRFLDPTFLGLFPAEQCPKSKSSKSCQKCIFHIGQLRSKDYNYNCHRIQIRSCFSI